MRWLVGLAGLLVALGAVALWQAMVQGEAATMEEFLEEQALHTAADLRSELGRREAALSRVGRRLAVKAEGDRGAFDLEAAILLADFPYLDVLVWIRPDGVVWWSRTRPGPEALSPPEETPALRQAMDVAQRTGTEQFCDCIRQPDGKEGLAIVEPVERAGGVHLLVAAFRLPDVVEALLPAALARQAVVVEDEVGVRFVLGLEAISNGPEASAPQPVDVEGLSWWVRAEPTRELQRELGTALPEVVLTSGLLLAVMLSSALWFFGLSRRRAFVAEEARSRLEAEIEERRRVEAALERFAKRLKQSNEDLDRFAQVVAHDLREPLVTLRLYAAELRHEIAAGGDQAMGLAERLEGAALQMDALLQAVLDHARAATGGSVRTTVPLEEVVQEVVAYLKGRIEAMNGRIEVGRLPVVDADRAQMQQLFQNLLGNALKFSRPGVPPFVRVTAEPILVPPEGAATDGLWSLIRVTDNGIGLDPADAVRAFEEFERLDAAQTYEGTGMGLAICRRIVEAHGGSILARPNADGPGTTLEVRLPVHPDRPSQAGPNGGTQATPVDPRQLGLQ